MRLSEKIFKILENEKINSYIFFKIFKQKLRNFKVFAKYRIVNKQNNIVHIFQFKSVLYLINENGL
jgi:hypothetical protein